MEKLTHKIRLFILSMLYFVAAGCSSNTANDLNAIVSEEANRLLSESKFNAVSIALVTNQETKTFHLGVFDDGTFPTDDTIYDLGSITKTHVGLILAKAVADGLISLDEPVIHYLPTLDRSNLTYDGVEITVRHLATHLSGLPTDLACGETNISAKQRLSCFMSHDDSDLLKRLDTFQLIEKPGSQYRYSNPGIRIIGIVLEKLYDKPLELILEEVVFRRTGQVETFTMLPPDDFGRWRRGSHESGVQPPDASAYFNAAGGLKSTVTDMGKYLNYHVNGNHELANNALSLLAGDAEGLGRAYIWNTFRLSSEGQLYHGGGTFGTSAWVSLYPREGLAIFLVSPFASDSAQQELNVAANRIVARYRKVVNEIAIPAKKLSKVQVNQPDAEAPNNEGVELRLPVDG